MANNGRVRGQIGLGKPKVSFSQNKNSGTNRGGQTGTTRLANSVTISSSGQVSRNSRSAALGNPHTMSTVGLKGARATKTTHQPRLHGRPSVKQEGLLRTAKSKTSTRLGRQSPDTMNTVGLKGSSTPRNKLATGSNLRKTSPDAINSQGLKRASKRAPRQSLQSAGTPGSKAGGGRKTPLIGNRRQVTSTLKPQKNYNASIPAAIRRAAARAPSIGSSKPSFTSRVTKILSK
jgi:hypothetical protein